MIDVGTSQVISFEKASVKERSACLDKATDKEPDLKNYALPPRDSSAIVKSLLFQAGRHVPTNPQPHILSSMAHVIAMYPEVNPPNGFDQSRVNWSRVRETIEARLWLEVKPKSSPGVPFMHVADSNFKLREKHSSWIVSAVMARLKKLVRVNPEVLHCANPVELVQGGYCDPIKLFVKNEFHDLETKIKTGRVRLISSVSLVDQIVERILCTSQNKAEKMVWRQIPSKCGIGFSDPDNNYMWESVSAKGQNAESDISGFDWSVAYHELLADARMRVELAGADTKGCFARALYARVRCLSCAVFHLPNGQMVAQSMPGLQKSGSYNTSPTNSRIRVLMAVLVGARWAIAAGDDCVEEYVEGAQALYTKLGRICKYYEAGDSKTFRFCSREYKATGSQPLGWLKGLANLLQSKDQSIMLYDDFRREYADSIHFEWCVYVLEAAGWGGQNFSF